MYGQTSTASCRIIGISGVILVGAQHIYRRQTAIPKVIDLAV